MPHPRGKRSRNAKLRRAARSYIVDHSFLDVIYAETVCRSSRVEVVNFLTVEYRDLEGGIQYSDIPDVEPGFVLTDSRGRGVFQN